MSATSFIGYIDKRQVFLSRFTNEEYLNFIENLICDLEGYEDRFYMFNGKSYIDNQLLLAESKLYRVTLLDFGCKFGVCLSVIPENALRSSLAEFCFDKEVNRIFDAIASYYNVITDNCYWTSAKRLMPSLFHRPQQPFLAEQKFA